MNAEREPTAAEILEWRRGNEFLPDSEATAQDFPRLTNMSATFMFDGIVRPLDPTPPEYVTLSLPYTSDLALVGAVGCLAPGEAHRVGDGGAEVAEGHAGPRDPTGQGREQGAGDEAGCTCVLVQSRSLGFDVRLARQNVAMALLELWERGAADLARRNTPDPAGVSAPIKVVDRAYAVERLTHAATTLRSAIDNDDDEYWVRSELVKLWPDFVSASPYGETKARIAARLQAGKRLAVTSTGASQRPERRSSQLVPSETTRRRDAAVDARHASPPLVMA